MIRQKEIGPGVAAPSPKSEVSSSASFSAIIHHLAEKAKVEGFDSARVDRAVGLLLHPTVHERCWIWDLDYQTLNLRNGDGSTWYRVNGSCQCGDYQYRTIWCKHRLARKLLIEAEEVMETEAKSERDTALLVDYGRGRSKMWKV